MDDQGRNNGQAAVQIESARRCTESGVLFLQVHQFDFCAAGGASGEANNEAVFKLAGIRPGESLAHVLILCLHSASWGSETRGASRLPLARHEVLSRSWNCSTWNICV